MKKLKNFRKLEITALVCLMLPVIALVEGAKPQPETAEFRIQIGTESGDNVVLTGFCDVVTSVNGWGEDAYWNINPRGGGYTFELADVCPGIYTIDLDLAGDDGTVYWLAGTEQQACLGYLFHMVRWQKVTGGGKPKEEVYSDYWAFGIYWYNDVDGQEPLDRVCLIVETDHSDDREWESMSDNSIAVHFEDRPYTLVWYKLEERSIRRGKSWETIQEWKWQGYLRKDTDPPDDVTLSFTVTIEKLPQ